LGDYGDFDSCEPNGLGRKYSVLPELSHCLQENMMILLH